MLRVKTRGFEHRAGCSQSLARSRVFRHFEVEAGLEWCEQSGSVQTVAAVLIGEFQRGGPSVLQPCGGKSGGIAGCNRKTHAAPGFVAENFATALPAITISGAPF